MVNFTVHASDHNKHSFSFSPFKEKKNETSFHLVAQAGFERVILLCQPPECWDYRYVLPHLALMFLLKTWQVLGSSSTGQPSVLWIQGPFLTLMGRCEEKRR
jgi:hypothetical protein